MGRRTLVLISVALAIGLLACLFVRVTLASGPRWRVARAPILGGGFFQCLQALGPDSVFFAGPDSAGREALWMWDGREFVRLAEMPCVSSPYGFYMVSPTEGWVGNCESLWRWDGEGWTEFENPLGIYKENYDCGPIVWIQMLSSSEGWAIARLWAARWPMEEWVGGAFLRWNGSSWEVAQMTEEKCWWGDMLSSEDGWAVGDNGTILHWDGREWSVVPSPVDCWLWSVDMLSPTEGWAVSFGRGVLRYG